MIAGFTGTRNEPTRGQIARFLDALQKHAVTELHHGDCQGADEAAHLVARSLGLKVVVHPPIKHDIRAFCNGDEVLEEKDYLVRNRDIVDACDHLFAIPMGPEVKRSGTWSTIRYARNKKPITIIMP